MSALDTLDIDSDFSPGSMLDEFHFENLKVFKLQTHHSKLAFFQGTGFNSIIWEKLEATTIYGDYDQEESERIKNRKLYAKKKAGQNLIYTSTITTDMTNRHNLAVPFM
ncbi:hypothetical protein H0H87_003733 [Tephrocybe sp. NHM501043]|nr:hypothetical protein H0H87_003733 [Tephrocybe sp. NHM501043]